LATLNSADQSPLSAALVDRGHRRRLRVKDANGHKLGYFYFEDDEADSGQRGEAAGREFY